MAIAKTISSGPRAPGPIILAAPCRHPQYDTEAAAREAAERVANANGQDMVVYLPVLLVQPVRGTRVSSLRG